MSTLEGRTVRFQPAPVTSLRLSDYQALTEQCHAFPYGLVNVASEHALYIPRLFMDPAHRDHITNLHLLDLTGPDHVPSVVTHGTDPGASGR